MGKMAVLIRQGLICALLLFVVCASHSAEHVSIGEGGVDKIIYLPATLAQRLGYFADEGLDVELKSEASGVHAVDELLSGSVQAVMGSYDHTIDLQAKGKSVVSVVQLGHSPGEALIIAQRRHGEYRAVSDLQGATIGVTGIGSSTHFLSQYLMIAAGLKLSQSRFVPIKQGEVFIDALASGQIDAGMTSEPTISRGVMHDRAHILVDLRAPEETRRALGGSYPGVCLYLQTAWVARNRATVQKLVNALVRSLRYIQSHSAAEIAANVPESFYYGDRPGYVRALTHAKPMFTPDGRMPADGPETVWRVLSTIDRTVKDKRLDLKRTYTTEFVAAVK